MGWVIAFSSPLAGLFLSIIPLVAFIVLSKPSIIIYSLLFFLPFQSIPIFAQNIAGITGAKLSNFLAGGALIVLLMKEKNFLSFRDPLEKKTLFYMTAYFLFFSIAFFRSIENLSLLHSLNPDQFQSSTVSYVLSFYVRPALYLVAPLFILKSLHTAEEINRAVDALIAASSVLSALVLVVMLMHFGEFSRGRGGVQELCSTYLGMHYNSVGTILLISAPLLIIKALEKGLVWKMGLAMTIMALLFLQSRSALFTFLGTGLLLLWVMKRKKILLVATALVVIAALFWLPPMLMKGITSGVEKGTADAVFSGRISHLWIPLLREWIANPNKFIFGAGQYGLMTSPLWKSGFLVQAAQAHNAFLNFFLNNGILLLILFVSCITRFTIKARNACKKINTPLCWALFTSVVAYLIGTMSERVIYPHNDNMLLLPIIALLINLIRLHNSRQGQSKNHSK